MENRSIFTYARVSNNITSAFTILEMQDNKAVNIYDPITGALIMKADRINWEDFSISDVYNVYSTSLKELVVQKSLPLPQNNAFIGYKIIADSDAISEYLEEAKKYNKTVMDYSYETNYPKRYFSPSFVFKPSLDNIIVNHYAIAVLYIPKNADLVDYNSPNTMYLRKYRTNKAKVLQIKSIYNNEYYKKGFSIYNNNFIYTQGKFVHAFIDYNADTCGSGIHFFMTPQEAIYYAFNE